MDITLAREEKCHTYVPNDKITSQRGNRGIFFLKRGLDYRIFIHDLNYFLISGNPKAYPGFQIFIPSSEENSPDIIHIQTMEISEHVNLNLENINSMP